MDAEELNEKIVELCKESYKVIMQAYNLQHQKASEILLFVITDSDRAFNKDKPSTIPLAYALKECSIKVATARKMINMVRDRLKENKTSTLCKSVDGQWSGVVFRDEQLRPLTLFELQHDSWNKFCNKSKERLIQFIEDLSYVTNDDKEHCSEIDIDYFSSHRYGNLEVNIEPFRRPPNNEVHHKIYMHSYSGPYNQGCALRFLRTPKKVRRPDLWQINIGVHNNLMEVLGLREPRNQSSDTLADSLESTNEDDESLLNLRTELMDESDRTPDTSELHFNVHSCHDHISADDIKALLLISHKYILEEILIALLSSERQAKWTSFNCMEFYNFALSSINAIYANMTNHDLDIAIHVFRKVESKTVPLGIKLNASKLIKANQLGFILGHTDVITPKKSKPKLLSLKDLAVQKLKESVPTDVLKVALASFDFAIKLPLWMDKCPLQMSYNIPLESSNFDIFFYPEYCATRQQIEPRVIDPSHILTNLCLHATQKGILHCDPEAFLRVSDSNHTVLNRGLLIEPIADKQSVPFARRVFSKEVQDIIYQMVICKEQRWCSM